MAKAPNSKQSEKQSSQKTKVIKKTKSTKQKQPSQRSSKSPSKESQPLTDPAEFVFGTTTKIITIPLLRADQTLDWQLPAVDSKIVGIFDRIVLMAVSVSGGLEYTQSYFEKLHSVFKILGKSQFEKIVANLFLNFAEFIKFYQNDAKINFYTVFCFFHFFTKKPAQRRV